MKQATSLRGLRLSPLLPGMTLNTSPTDYRPIKQMQLMSFNGKNWELFGELLSEPKSTLIPIPYLIVDVQVTVGHVC